MSRPIQVLEVDAVQRADLARIVRAPSSSQRDVLRARIVLARADGLSQQQTAEAIGVQRTVVGLWTRRFACNGIAGLADAPGRGRPCTIDETVRNRVIVECVRPPPGHTRWTTRTMAKHVGVSPATVLRLWQANDIKPHLMRTFKLSNDQHFGWDKRAYG